MRKSRSQLERDLHFLRATYYRKLSFSRCVCRCFSRNHQPANQGWDGAWTSPLECCAPQALVEKRPYIYMGGYDPKVIKNREKLHFFFRLPLFLPSLLGKTKGFRCKKRAAFLRICRHFLISTPQLSAIFTLVFRKISVVFAQTMDFLEISDLRGKTAPLHSLKTSPSLSLKTSVFRPQKSPPHEVQRGLFIVFRG